MKYYLIILTILFSCKQKPTQLSQVTNDLDLKRGAMIACGPPNKEFGTVDFASSCSSSTQKDFTLGVAMLHSFEYEESEKAFVRVLDIDSNCAMAYWGVAMSNFHQVWPSPPTPEELEKGSKAVQRAKSLSRQQGISSDYINTIAAFYLDYSKYSQRERILNYAKAMADMYKKYPDDKEVTIFYALSLVSAADPSDKNYSNQKKAGKILESLYPGQARHPGIVHYIIHAYDSPELASMALEAARKYASIAPASAHAQHMPSHIFTRLGLWDEAMQSNIEAAASAKCYAESAGIKGHWDEELHAIDYLIYSYLQKGDNIKAKSTLDYLTSFTDVQPVNFKVLFTFAASPSRYYLENNLWIEASALAFQSGFPWEKFPWQKAIVHFTRSLGAARTGNIDTAKAELQKMQPCHDSLAIQKDDYKANQVKIQMTIANAWILFGEQNKAEAVKQMELAAEMEDKTEKSPVTPGEVLPARQLLGDMLMEMNEPGLALIAYEADLKKHPNRFNSLARAAKASEKMKDMVKCKVYYEKLLAVAPSSTRVEIVEARAVLSKVNR
jgi:hypothetical protein